MHMKKKGNRKMKWEFVLMIKEHTFIQVGADSSGCSRRWLWLDAESSGGRQPV
jgi:hypothetical protein